MTIWTSQADELALAGRLEATGRLATSVIGQSANGTDILAWRIGGDTLTPPDLTDPATLLYVGCQHGDEPASREGLLALAQHLTDVHLNLPGAAGSYSSTPDAVTLDITGDVVLRCGVITAQWGVAGGNRYLVSKWTTTADQRSYTIRIGTAGTLQFAWSTDGTSGGILTATATAQPTPNHYGAVFVAAEIDVDDGAGNRVITFHEAPSMAGPWTQLGDQVVQAGATSIFSGTGVLEIGTINIGATSVWATQILAAHVEDGIGGSVVADPDFTTQTVGAGSFDDSTGKTWTVHGTAAIAAAATSAERTFLDSFGVLMIPTANPDGTPTSRLNGDSVDVNRHHLDLDAPEADAIASVMQSAAPLVVADHHEFGSEFAAEDILFAEPRHPAAHSGIVTSANSLIAALETRATAETWTFADYPTSTTSPSTAQRLVANSGLRHSVAVLIETRETADDDAGQTARTDIHFGLSGEVLTYVITNQATLATGQATAQADKEAEGTAGAVAYQLGGGVTIDPPPLGYLLIGVIPNALLGRFGIAITASTVSMGQPAQPVIPLLFDQASSEAVTGSARLFSLPAPGTVATVQDFAPIVSGSHEPLFEARVLSTFQIGSDPTGTTITILGGDVAFDGTAQIRATLELVTAGISELDGKSVFPRRAGDLLAPYGTEVFVRRGVDLGGGGQLWSPLGYYRINTVEQPDGPYGPIRLSCTDRMAGIIDARVVSPYYFRSSRTIQHVVDVLVSDVYANAVVLFDDNAGQDTIGRQLVVEESRYEALLDIAESLGKIMYWDGDGFLRIVDPPTSTAIVWDIRAGRNGVLVDAGREVTREGMYNAVVATGEGASASPVRALVVDRGPNSPTKWAGPFGRVPRFYASPLLVTVAQCRAAATSLLRRSIGMPYRVNFNNLPNPALRPYDPIRITHQDGNREKHIVEACTIPLTTSAPMTGRTREQTLVSIGDA